MATQNFTNLLLTNINASIREENNEHTCLETSMFIVFSIIEKKKYDIVVILEGRNLTTDTANLDGKTNFISRNTQKLHEIGYLGEFYPYNKDWEHTFYYGVFYGKDYTLNTIHFVPHGSPVEQNVGTFRNSVDVVLEKDGKKLHVLASHFHPHFTRPDWKLQASENIKNYMASIPSEDFVIAPGDYNFFEKGDINRKCILGYGLVDMLFPLLGRDKHDNIYLLEGSFVGSPQEDPKYQYVWPKLGRLMHCFAREGSMYQSRSVQIKEEVDDREHLPTDHLMCEITFLME